MAIPLPAITGSKLRILLIEDNDISRQLMTDFLIDSGYEVYAMSEAYAFTSVMDQFVPHLILLDLKLPGIDGYDILLQLQQTATWQTIPVIVVSAFAFEADKNRALSLGARQYLVKPIKLHELTLAITEETGCLAV
jgi:two-component system cell cycle response regulator DivK